MINFKTDRWTNDLIQKIVDRAQTIFKERDYSRQKIDMDITACHCNGCPLDLKKLLEAPRFDFVHDIAGIHNHINRDTGKLMNCFIPRCAA